jgi:peptidoglycan/LPS O-acetylase OafA/YrhL
MDHATRRARIDSLDALRGLCALSVALYHFHTSGTLSNLPFIRHGWMLVDFFFVLSGFVITAAYADDLHKGYPIGRFLLLRLARIWPLHAVMLLCFLALELSKVWVQVPPFPPMFAPPRELGSFFANLLLLQIFGLYDTVTWNAPSWSIAAEFWVYVLAAVLFRFAGRERTTVLVVTAGLCALAIFLAGEPFLNLTYSGSVIRCLLGFSIGSLTWSVFERGAAQAHATPAATSAETHRVRSTAREVLAIFAVGTAIWFLDGGPLTLALPLLFAACVLVLAQQDGLVSRVLSRRVPVWLGTISYSIYMTHLFVEGRLLDILTIAGRVLDTQYVERVVVDGVAKRIVIGSELFINCTLATLILLILGVSYASYRLVEQPCNRWLRARLERRSSPLVPSPAT